MEQIHDTNSSFDFSKITFLKPTLSTGGNYFIKMLMQGKPIYAQPPQCITKQGIITTGKKYYCDLMFTNEHESFIQWMETLEQACQKSIYEHRETWFDGDMEMHDIENYFTSPMKLYKSGKFYIVRTNVSLTLGKPTLTVYDEDANQVSIESIGENTNVMTILEIQGIKCSARSFQIEIELKQMMTVQPTTIFNTCVFTAKKEVAKPVVSQPPSTLESQSQDQDQAQDQAQDQDTVQTQEEEVLPLPHSEEDSGPTVETPLEKNDDAELAELSIHLDESTETVTLKNRNDVHYEIYIEARRKARIARDAALAAYLEAKRIKNVYMLDELSSEEEEPVL